MSNLKLLLPLTALMWLMLGHHAVYAQNPKLKLLIEQPGLYQVTYADLKAMNSAWLQGDPRHLQLSQSGQVVPLWFVGENDALFNEGDYFLFYGQIPASDYTRQHVYWLESVNSLGARMMSQSVPPINSPSPTMFTTTQYYEQELRYWQSAPTTDHWFWQRLESNATTPIITATLLLTLPHIAAPSGQLRLHLHGATSGDHAVAIYLNGQSIGQATWTGLTELDKTFALTMPFTQNQQLQLINQLPDNQSSSDIYLNWFEVTYFTTYQATNDTLTFSLPLTANQTVIITDFSQPTLDVFDLTDPDQPIILQDYVIEPVNQSYRLRFTVSPRPARFSKPSRSESMLPSYLAQTTARRLSPHLLPYQPTTWPTTLTGATYLMVTHPDFYTVTQKLAAYRRQQGEIVAVITVNDLYDAFTFGCKDPVAIRKLVEYTAANWRPQPRYLLLVGDASFDPKNNRGDSLPDFLPARYVDTPLLGQTPNDNDYVSGNNNILVGRITARTEADMQAVIDKIINYEQTTPSGDWQQRAILVADDDEPTFVKDMETVATLLPHDFNITKLYSGTSTTLVRDTLNSGALLLAYSGHGNVGVWGEWADQYRIFNRSRAAELQNGYKLPFMTSVNCLNGSFTEYDRDRSLAEEMLLQPNKGAVAVLASAGYGYPTPNSLFQEQLYRALTREGSVTLGAAAHEAMLTAMTLRPDLSPHIFETMIFFGDPATRLTWPPSSQLKVSFTTSAPDLLGTPTTFRSSSTGLNLSYQWDFGDGQRSAVTNDPQIEYNYQAHGCYTAALAVTNVAKSDVVTQTVCILTTPLVSFTVSSPLWVGQGVIFSHTSDLGGESPDQVRYVWDFGDGNQSSAARPSHRYDQAGRYDVRLTVFNRLAQATMSQTLSINEAPIQGLQAIYPNPTTLGQPTSFLAVIATGTAVSYQWDFGTGAAAQGKFISYRYPQAGQYIVTLTATNPISTVVISQIITILDNAPVAQFTTSSPDTLGQTTFFNSLTNGRQVWHEWAFGDNTTVISGYNAINVSHSYTKTGDYIATLTTTNGLGQSVITQLVQIIADIQPPVADFSFSQTVYEVGQTVILSNLSQDGGASEVSYLWAWGDGEITNTINPTHTYSTPGHFTVTLTVTNPRGQAIATQTITITEQAIQGLTIRHDSPTRLGEVTTLTASVTHGTAIRYTWQWGDGMVMTGAVVSHSYTVVGEYVVILTATNEVGAVVATDKIMVIDVPLQGLTLLATAPLSQPITVGTTITFTAQISAGSNPIYQWDLGLGVTGTAQIFTYTFRQAGDFLLTLQVSNGVNQQVILQTISVQDVPINGLTLQHDTPIMAGETTHFTATVTAGSGVSYIWQWGDNATGAGATASHEYAAAGTYTVTLTATNSHHAAVVTETVQVKAISNQFLPLLVK